MKLHPEILTKNGKKEFVVLPYEEFVALRELLDNAEDILDLRAAKKKEADRHSVGLKQVRDKFLSK